MSENPQVKAILEHIETRERELADQAGQFRAHIEELTRQLGELDAESENLRITRKTLLTLPLPSPATGPDRPDIPDHPAYQQRLTTALASVVGPHLAPQSGRAFTKAGDSYTPATGDVVEVVAGTTRHAVVTVVRLR